MMKMAWLKIRLGRSETLVLIILVLGIGLRLWGSWLPFMEDGTDIIPIARDVSLLPSKFNLPPHGSDHGPFLTYQTRLSSLVFGQSPLGWRLGGIILAVLSFVILYFLVRDGLGKVEAVIAMALVAFNGVHIFYSRYNVEEAPIFFTTALILFCFWMAFKKESGLWMLLAGVSVGLGMLSKLVTLFPVPGLFLFLLFSSRGRRWFKRPELYLAGAVALAIFSPYLYWNWQHNWFDYGNAAKYIEPFGFYGITLDLFLGGFFPMGDISFESDFGYEYMGRLAGLVLVIGIFYSLRRVRRSRSSLTGPTVGLGDECDYVDFVRMMHFAFWSVVAVSLLVVVGQGRHFVLLVLPAAALASTALADLWRWERERQARFVAVGVIVALFGSSAWATHKFGEYWVTTAEVPLAISEEGHPIDMTSLAKGLIEVVRKYEPTLVVLPGKSLRATGSFMEAYSGWKVVSSKKQHRWRKVYAEDLKKVVVILVAGVKERRYKEWAGRHNLKRLRREEEEVWASRRFRGHEEKFSLPVRILVFEARDRAGRKAGEDLMNLLVPLE